MAGHARVGRARTLDTASRFLSGSTVTPPASRLDAPLPASVDQYHVPLPGSRLFVAISDDPTVSAGRGVVWLRRPRQDARAHAQEAALYSAGLAISTHCGGRPAHSRGRLARDSGLQSGLAPTTVRQLRDGTLLMRGMRGWVVVRSGWRVERVRYAGRLLLDDGSTVVVERSVAFNETNSLAGDTYNAVETEATLAFTGRPCGLPVWSAPLMAMLLYRDQTRGGQWVIVATTTSCEVWNMRGEPPSMYWEYRLGPQGWQEVMLSPTSIGRKANLLHRYQKKLGTRHITVADRQERESDTRIAKTYKEILAAPEFPCTPSVKH